jgi:hypothetical protein
MTNPERNSNSGGPQFQDDAAFDDPHDPWTSKGLTVWIAKVRESSRNDERTGVKSPVRATRPRKPSKTAA